MELLNKLILAVLILSILTFVALFGQLPALRKTPIGWLRRVLCVHIPSSLERIDRSVTNGRLSQSSQRLGYYLFYESNPVVLIIFISVITISAILYIPHAYPYLSATQLLSLLTLLSLPYLFTYLCVSHTAHYITPPSHSLHLQSYPYDHILYRPNRVCTTCQHLKPARSKHCNFCRACVSKCDHHCPWVNNCLGRGNYHYFLYLLASLTILQLYAAYLAYRVLHPHFAGALGTAVQAPFFSLARFDLFITALALAIQAGGISIAGVGLLAVSTAVLPFGLLVYHCYLIWAGTTTNEAQKWSDWAEDMRDGTVFRADRGRLREYVRWRREESRVHGGGGEGWDVFEDDVDGWEIEWPLQSEVVLVRTSDGKAPRGQEGLWTQVWDLKDVVNIYDLGGWRNLMEALRGR